MACIMVMKYFLKAVMFIVGLAAVAVSAEILANVFSANFRRIDSAAHGTHIREYRF